MLTAALAVLCALLVLVLLVQRPAIWPVLVVLAVLWFALFGVFRYQVRSWVARWVCGGSFEKSKTQFSLEPLSQPAALLSGETVLWYNTEFRTRLMKGEALLVPRVQKALEQQIEARCDVRRKDHAARVPAMKQRTEPLARLKNELLCAVGRAVAAARDIAAAAGHIPVNSLWHACWLWEAGAGVVEIDGRHTNPSFVFLIVPTIYQECK